MRKRVFLAIFMILLIAVFLTSCGLFKNPDNNSNTNGDPDLNGSWEDIHNESPEVVYTLLFSSIKNSLEDMSTERVKAPSNYLSVNTKFKIELNNLSLWLELKLNYDLKKPEDLMVSLELINDKNGNKPSVLLGVYFKDEKVYISIKDGDVGEISFPIEHNILSSLLPLKHDKDNTMVENATIALQAMLDVNGISGRKRQDGLFWEYEYWIDINLPETLESILRFFDIEENEIEGLDKELISTIIKHIFGLTLEDIESNGMPESNMRIEFSTFNTRVKTFKMDMSIDIDPSAQGNIIEGDSIDILLELEELQIKNGTDKSVFTSIPFFGLDAKYLTFPNYMEQTFGLLLNIVRKGDTVALDDNLMLKSEIKIDLDTIENNQLLFEFYDIDNTDSSPIIGIYVYDNMFYFYQTDDGGDYLKRLEFEIDIVEIFRKIKSGVELDIPGEEPDGEPDEGEEQTSDATTALEYISYFVGAIKLADDKLTFIINEDFFNTVLPGIENFIPYVEELTGEDIQSLLDDLELDLIGFLLANTFEIYIDFSEDAESFIYILDEDINFPDGVDGRIDNGNGDNGDDGDD